MPTKLPPLNWLRTFEVAARELNFTVAARELNITQSAVSQQVRLLEGHLGEPLFNRLPRQITLTKRGRAFLPIVQLAIQALQRGTLDLFPQLKSEEVTIEVNTAFAILWLAPRLQTFTAQYPELTLRVINANWDSEFASDSAELSLRHGTGNWPNRDSTRLVTPKLRPYCSPEMAKQIHKPEDVLQWPLLNVIGNRKGWPAWLAQYNLALSDTCPTHKMDTVATAVALATGNCGVCLCYDEFVVSQVTAGQLVAPLDHYLTSTESYYLSHRKDCSLSKAAKVFKEWLLKEISEGTGLDEMALT